MAKYKEKKHSVEANYFNASDNPSQWPPNVQANVLSPTGYSYGTLEQTLVDIGDNEEYIKIDGFAIPNNVWVIVDYLGNANYMTNEEFQREYELN